MKKGSASGLLGVEASNVYRCSLYRTLHNLQLISLLNYDGFALQ